jgi:alkaline phosphatase D
MLTVVLRCGEIVGEPTDDTMANPIKASRREFLRRAGLFASGCGFACSGLPGRVRAAPARIAADSELPQLRQGIQIGDVFADRAIVWARAHRPARLIVDWDRDERLRSPRRVVGPSALAASDFTARVDLSGLPAGQPIFLRAAFQSLNDARGR